MARAARSIVGIELQERFIRVVEASVGPTPVVYSAGEASMPAHAFQNGLILKTDWVASTLKNLVDSLGISTVDCIFGVPPACTVLRTLSVPPVPEAELAHIVDGEVKHYRLVSTEGAVYNFFSLRAPAGASSGDAHNVLFAGVEGPIISAIRDVANKAGLTVMALEPVPIAMYRTVSEALTGPTTMALIISESQSAMVMHAKGEISLFREVDIGSNSLVLHHVGDDPFLNPRQISGEEDSAKLNTSLIQPGPANALTIELKRSIEFFQREFRDEEPIDRLVIASAELGIQSMIPWLSHEVGLPVELLSTFKTPVDREPIQALLMPPNGAKFSAAYGLALHGAYDNKPSIPSMDLYIRERSVEELEEKRKGVAGSLVMAIVVILLGLFFSYKFGVDANHAEHELGHLTEDVAMLEAQSKQSTEESLRVRQQYDLLVQDGVPLSRLMDAIAERVTGPVGLTDIQIDNTGKVEFSGETIDENSTIRLADSLKRAPLLSSAGVTSFEKIDPEGTKQGFKFKITSQGTFGKPAPEPGAHP